MDARELRIGNFVIQHTDGHYNLVNTVQKVVGIIGRIVYFGTESGGYDINNRYLCSDQKMCHPIPLTEELLLKCGFEIMSDDLIKFTLPHTAYRISFTRGTVYTDIGKGSEHWFLHVDNFDCATIGCGRLEFLHQLQNLYFALTGEELKVKL